jgi:c-di-GMP-binding flagellar brake protein YcgR
MALPMQGEMVKIEYLVIDELEAQCWLSDYNVLGYLDNSDMRLKLSDQEKKSQCFVSSIDPETGRIELSRMFSNKDLF